MRTQSLGTFLFVFSLSAFAFQNAQAIETRLELNGSLNLDTLRGSQEIQAVTGRQGDVYSVDASVVMDLVPARFEAVALDFDLQRSLGMPSTPESHNVVRSGDDLVGWIHMSAIGADSRHYLAIHIQRTGLSSPQAWAAQWQMVPGQPGWGYEDAPAFGRIEGSMFLLPLGSGNPNERQPVYVRYFTLAEVKSFLPGWLISTFVRGHLASDVESGLKILEAQAQ